MIDGIHIDDYRWVHFLSSLWVWHSLAILVHFGGSIYWSAWRIAGYPRLIQMPWGPQVLCGGFKSGLFRDGVHIKVTPWDFGWFCCSQFHPYVLDVLTPKFGGFSKGLLDHSPAWWKILPQWGFSIQNPPHRPPIALIWEMLRTPGFPKMSFVTEPGAYRPFVIRREDAVRLDTTWVTTSLRSRRAFLWSAQGIDLQFTLMYTYTHAHYIYLYDMYIDTHIYVYIYIYIILYYICICIYIYIGR